MIDYDFGWHVSFSVCATYLLKYWTVEFFIAKSRQFHVLDNFGILSRTQWCCPDILSDTTMSNFPEHHSPGNWRPIIRETDSDSSSVSSSSENVSPKGAKFEEEHTYSSKASCNVSPTFGDTHAHDTKWSTTFLNRELCQGSSWMVPKSRQGWSVCPWYNTSSDSWEDSDTMSRSLWCSQETGKHCVSLRFSCARS